MENSPPSTAIVTPLPQLLHLTLDEYLSIQFGNDALYSERHWLMRNTFASGAHCHVVTREFYERVFKLDPQELTLHFHIYETPQTKFPCIYTIWPRGVWLESNERIRLSRDKSSKRLASLTNRDTCTTIANLVAIQVFPSDKVAKDFATSLITIAAKEDYSVNKFLDYLEHFNKTSLPNLDFTSQHQHYRPIVTPTITLNETSTPPSNANS